MSLLESLQRTKLRIGSYTRRNTDDLAQAVQSFQDRYLTHEIDDDGEILDQLEAFLQRLRNKDWSGYAWHRASGLLRGLFQTEHVHDARWADVTDTLLATLEGTDKRAFLRAGVETYLRTYGENSEPVRRLSEALRSRDRKQDARQMPLLAKFDIFEPEAHLKVAGALGQSDAPYQEVKRWGIASPHMPGFFARAFEAMASQQADARKRMDTAAFERILNWLAPENGVVSQFNKVTCINALLLPFHENAEAGTDVLRERIRRQLTTLFKDPRVDPSRWVGVDPRAMDVLRRWLTTRSLAVFFEVIDTFEGHSHWKSRKEFWSSVNDSKMIDDAWVVLSADGVAEAKSLATKSGDTSFLDHGAIQDSREPKCFFIMKIGRLTVIEGTHNFKLRILSGKSPKAPALGQPYYRYGHMVLAEAHCEVAYTHDQNERWMMKAQNYLRQHS